MSGKKVFTNAGEKLAEFLIAKKDKDIVSSNLINILETINGTTPTVEQQFIRVSGMSKEEIVSFFTEQIRLFLNNLNITNGEKEVHLLDITQELFNSFKYQEITSQSQFEAISSFIGTKLADIVKTIGSLNRSYQVADNKLNKTIAELVYKPLEYFQGGPQDKHKIYYRFSGAALVVSNGIANAQKFSEVFRVESIVNTNQSAANPASSILGDAIVIGIDPQFKSIELSKPTKVKGDLTLENGELLGTAIKSRYGDIAEYYSTDKEYSPGTLLMLNLETDLEATMNDCSAPLIGVVSYKPGFILNEELKHEELIMEDSENMVPPEYHNDNLSLDKSKFIVPIVLTGKTPTKMHSLPLARGRISKGDILFPSMEIKGVAVAVPYKDSYQFEIDTKRKPIGIALSSSYPKLISDDSSEAYKEIQLIYSKIN